MEQAQELVFTRRPTAINTLYHAVLSGKHRIMKAGSIRPVYARWEGIYIKPKTIAAFCSSCNIPNRNEAPFLFPFSLIYPFKLRLISSPFVPVPMFRMLTIRNSITCYRNLQAGDTVDLIGYVENQRNEGNGMAFDVSIRIASQDQPIFNSVSTLFIPGFVFNGGEPSCEPPRLESIPDAPVSAEWFLPQGKGFRFARIMGDSNGIHFSRWYARMLGFKRDFSQPVMVASQCLELLPIPKDQGPVHLDLFFKGPAYYENRLILKSVCNADTLRFDLYCEGNERPCICGKRSSAIDVGAQ